MPRVQPDARRATLDLTVGRTALAVPSRVEALTGTGPGRVDLPSDVAVLLHADLALRDGGSVRLAAGRLPDGRALEVDVRLSLDPAAGLR